MPYLLIAGKKAIERYALAEAETHYRAAYDILLAQPESAERDHDAARADRRMVAAALLHRRDRRHEPADEGPRRICWTAFRTPELRGMWLTWHCFVGYCMLELARIGRLRRPRDRARRGSRLDASVGLRVHAAGLGSQQHWGVTTISQRSRKGAGAG